MNNTALTPQSQLLLLIQQVSWPSKPRNVPSTSHKSLIVSEENKKTHCFHQEPGCLKQLIHQKKKRSDPLPLLYLPSSDNGAQKSKNKDFSCWMSQHNRQSGLDLLVWLTTSPAGRGVRLGERAGAVETDYKLSVHWHYQKDSITPGLSARPNLPAGDSWQRCCTDSSLTV